MKKYLLVVAVVALITFVKQASAQTEATGFTGAQPKLDHYDALYVLNSSD